MPIYSSPQIASQLKPLLTALGKAQIKKSQVTISASSAGASVLVTGGGLRVGFAVTDPSDSPFTKTYELLDLAGVFDLDKTRFELDLESELLNDMPLFATDLHQVEVGVVKLTAEFPDVAPFINKPVLPETMKLLKKSLLHESEYILWRITADGVQLAQIHPLTWGVRYEAKLSLGVTFEAYTNKLESKLITKLLDGRFKLSRTSKGYLFEDATYSIFIAEREDLSAELYPPFALN